MQELINAVNRWTEEGKATVIATVTETWGSSPRGVGAQMVVSSDGEMVGSVSGGCVEGAVVDTCMEVFRTGQHEHLHFGVADETAWGVGLSCGGKIDVFVRPLDKQFFDAWRTAWDKEQKFVIVSMIQGPDSLIGRELMVLDNGEIVGSISSDYDGQALELATNAFTIGQSYLVTSAEGIVFFLNNHPPPATLIVVGGVHIAVALVSFANNLGYRTVVIDPRKAFANQARFSHADALYPNWPTQAFAKIKITESTAIAVLTHDPKIDDLALEVALGSSAFYVGALGSRKTQDQRRKRLLTAGLTEVQVSRLCAPIGLDLGSRSPEQVALAIMAEIIQVRNEKKMPSI